MSIQEATRQFPHRLTRKAWVAASVAGVMAVLLTKPQPDMAAMAAMAR